MHTFTSTWTPERIDNTERAIRAQRHDETSLLLVLLISPKTLVDSQVGSQRKSQPITHINLAKKTPNQKNPLLSLCSSPGVLVSELKLQSLCCNLYNSIPPTQTEKTKKTKQTLLLLQENKGNRGKIFRISRPNFLPSASVFVPPFISSQWLQRVAIIRERNGGNLHVSRPTTWFSIIRTPAPSD